MKEDLLPCDPIDFLGELRSRLFAAPDVELERLIASPFIAVETRRIAVEELEARAECTAILRRHGVRGRL